jgi:hypothetical protein
MRHYTSTNGATSFRSREAIDADTIRRLAPSVFADQAHDSRSARYTYIPTSRVLDALQQADFQVYAISQGGSRDEGKRGFTKHQIRLRHRSQTQAISVGDSIPEIVLLNSHDGSTSYQLSAGMYRKVCSNGLMVSTGTISEQRIHHKGDVVGQVVDGAIDLLEQLPLASHSIAEMTARTLSDRQQQILAEAATIARYGSLNESPLRPAALLTARRAADAAPDIWSTLNRVQENLIKGGVGYLHTDAKGHTSRRRTRQIKGIDQDTSLNRALWHIAEAMKSA